MTDLVAIGEEPLVSPEDHEKIDSLEAAILGQLVPVEMPLVHRFTPGLYAREIFMPAGTLLVSKIHNTEHPYVVLSGRARVSIPGKGVEIIEAGHVGVTKPGTRRVLYIEEDCRWITFHPLAEGESSEADLPKIEERIIEKRLRLDGRDLHQEYLAALDAFKLAPAGKIEEEP